jgi:predicted metal-dependent phosphoesterase TrpH
MIKIDFHVHSWISKDSSIVDSSLIVKILKFKGVSGFSLTDHDNWSAIPRFRALCKQNGVLFIPGCEIQTRNPKLGELLVYFSEEPICGRTVEEICDEAASSDALVFLSHPFDLIRQNWVDKSHVPYIARDDFRKRITGLEGINARNLILSSNRLACEWAQNYHLSAVGGSDAHSAMEIGEAYGQFSLANAVEKNASNDHVLEEIRAMLKKNAVQPGRVLNFHPAIHLFNILKKYTSGLTQVTSLVKLPLVHFGKKF